MKPIEPRPAPKTWQQWRVEMEGHAHYALHAVESGNAEMARIHATAAVHAAFYI